jgi:hypothetical protein
MLTKAKMALATALILGTASAALAGTDDGSTSGGFVMPGNLDGVNPAYHPGIFGNPATAKSYGFVQSTDGTWHVQANSHQRAG